ncbi:MAG TPA: YhjD/YihY/BrkB family envelope integrity protein [Flexivirga sp.]|uniref:YihY/virulence factor BrkB family protein n=1 Tax=Flexivirga sp. TaxID=1962927 RepID=UPI002BD1B86F|nr:YhjD/YihY/BrkB family envelope integrity protein [Flexivirga sp.]HWC23530.1 YhjD/YihY/BrkB family envelope integrity protein [Flexivirga sp.]
MSMLLLDEEEIERPKETPDTTAKADWKVALKRAAGKFSSDECTDKAAALTYFSMQSLFPGLIGVLSLINVFGNGKSTTKSIVKIVANIAGKDPSEFDWLTKFIDHVNTQGGGGIALAVGILLSIWSASGYVGGFSRALNRIYEVPEGRPVWKLRPALYLVTIVEVVLIIVVMFALVTTGKVASSIAGEIGIPSQAVQIWDIAKWPFVVLIVVFIIGMLYWATPNVRKTKRDIFTWGALIGFVVWVVASAALLIYLGLTQGASYQKTYGAFAGAIMFMLWLWITNIAMLFGAEVDAELIRTRQLKSGLPAEEMILLPPKDDSKFAGIELKAAKEFDTAHELRLNAMREAADDPNVFGRARMAAGHAAQVAGVASTSSRSGKTGLVGPRDASAPRAAVDTNTEVGAIAVGAEERAVIEESRLQRRDSWLLKAQKARLVRDRLDRQRAKQAKKEKQRQAEAAREVKIAESYVTRQDRWDSVEKVRAQFVPADTAEREQVRAERRARRATYDMEQAEKQAKAAQRPPEPEEKPKPKHESKHKSKQPQAPAVLRAEIEQEQLQRREEWFAGHPKRSAR